jgi:hypothetical protein
MSDTGETNMIVDYVLGESRRVDVAFAVQDAWEEIRRRVIKSFILDLKEDLTNHLNSISNDWIIELVPNDEWTRQAGNMLRVRRSQWSAEYYVGLRHDHWGPNNLWFGIWDLSINADARDRIADAFADWKFWEDSTMYLYFGKEFGEWEMGRWTKTASLRAMYDRKLGDYYKHIRDKITETAHLVDKILSAKT